MTTFIIAFTVAMFCAWCLSNAGFTAEAVIMAGVIGMISGAVAAHVAKER